MSLFKNSYYSSQDFLVSSSCNLQVNSEENRLSVGLGIPPLHQRKVTAPFWKDSIAFWNKPYSPDIFYLLCACFQLLKALTEGFTDLGLQQEPPCIITGLIKVLILIKMFYYCIMLNCSALQPH